MTPPTSTGAASPAAVEDPCAQVADDLGWGLGVLYRELLKSGNAVASDVPGGQRGYQVLAAVAGGGPGTQLALAQQLGVDRTVMTYLLDDLKRAGLIDRRPDPADRRARRVVITPAGQELYAVLQARMAGVGELILGSLEPAEREAFRSALQRAASALIGTGHSPGACEVAADIRSATGGPTDPAPAAPRVP